MTPELHRPTAVERIGQAGLAVDVEAGAEELAALAARMGLPGIGALRCRFQLRRIAAGIIEADGRVRGVYGEVIDLGALGAPKITRASHVEPDGQGRWLADMAPVGGPVLGPFQRRTDGLEAEMAWLDENWLVRSEGEGA